MIFGKYKRLKLGVDCFIEQLCEMRQDCNRELLENPDDDHHKIHREDIGEVLYTLRQIIKYAETGKND